jgi:hypothetical protein
MPSAGFEPATPATKRPQTYALDRAVTEVGQVQLETWKFTKNDRKLVTHGERKKCYDEDVETAIRIRHMRWKMGEK